jgi:hypothetical protein
MSQRSSRLAKSNRTPAFALTSGNMLPKRAKHVDVAENPE